VAEQITSLVLLVIAAGAVFFFIGRGKSKKALIDRMSVYNAQFYPKTAIDIKEIATQAGVPVSRVKRDMRLAEKRGLSFDIRIDEEGKTLIRGKEAWQAYIAGKERARLDAIEAEQRKSRLADPSTATFEEFRIESEDVLKKIRITNIELPGEMITEKLDNLEDVVSRIFSHVEKYPAKIPETRRLMNYHLPATLTIMEKYREYSEIENPPQNVKDAMTEIEHLFDVVDEAFENYLIKLLDTDTLDVTTDVEVLKRMLEKDGLTGGLK
jgi:hypothetical protein